MIAIRPSRPADRPALRAAIVALQEHERALHDTRLPGEACADACLAALAGSTILVAESAAGFLGFVAFRVECEVNPGETPDSNRHGRISDIFVRADHRGAGVAAALLAAAETQLAGENVSRVRVTSLAPNEVARRAYARHGFAPYEITYEKQLAGR